MRADLHLRGFVYMLLGLQIDEHDVRQARHQIGNKS
jgi:hypothetical protein